MSDLVKAIFDHGTFVTETPCDLPEGTRVLLAIQHEGLVQPPEVNSPEERARRAFEAQPTASKCAALWAGRNAWTRLCVMATLDLTDEQIRVRGLEALHRELGPAGVIRFLKQFEL